MMLPELAQHDISNNKSIRCAKQFFDALQPHAWIISGSRRVLLLHLHSLAPMLIRGDFLFITCVYIASPDIPLEGFIKPYNASRDSDIYFWGDWVMTLFSCSRWNCLSKIEILRTGFLNPGVEVHKDSETN